MQIARRGEHDRDWRGTCCVLLQGAKVDASDTQGVSDQRTERIEADPTHERHWDTQASQADGDVGRGAARSGHEGPCGLAGSRHEIDKRFAQANGARHSGRHHACTSVCSSDPSGGAVDSRMMRRGSRNSVTGGPWSRPSIRSRRS